MWFVFALLVVLAWGGADLFYKKGSDPSDKYSHLKITIMVGLVMGIHAIIYWIYMYATQGYVFNPMSMITYFPVSALYILSMVFGYVGLRYIELSVSSPIQNSSGAVTAILLLLIFREELGALDYIGIILVSLGVFLLSLLEKKQEDKERKLNNERIDKKYTIGFLAIIFPILYCIIDGLGTFADSLYLDDYLVEGGFMGEDDALLAYEFTFLLCAIVLLIYITLIKKQKFTLIEQKDRGAAAILETAGQFFYVFAMAENAVIAAPLVASYSFVSVLLSKIFLKEKLTLWQYLSIGVVMAGIVCMGVSEGLAEM